ncbi:tryptophan--tRNA ligase [Candidatus Uhrbacteria bacterium]|nr:tryptophan--tRNA ligase [Candidatus Uhrbacteria bacterium]
MPKALKGVILSGIQPSGNLHLGNYLGAIKNWAELQNSYHCYFCIVDLHAITVPQTPTDLRAKTIEVAKIYLAAGIDPKKCTIFVQSHVPAHAELGWILTTLTKVAEMERMTQFKDKAAKQTEGVGLGLLSYPALMAADILLYDSTLVPVGDDQTQHLEFTRVIGRRFNATFGETFKIPEQFTIKEGSRIMALDDTSKKMSKSAASTNSYIALTDAPDVIRSKIKRAVTDSGREIVYRADKPALQNLINIYHLLSGLPIAKIEAKYVGKGYGDFKTDLAEVVVEYLTPIQKSLAGLTDAKVMKILEAGAKKANKIASAKLEEVQKKVGFLQG